MLKGLLGVRRARQRKPRGRRDGIERGGGAAAARRRAKKKTEGLNADCAMYDVVCWFATLATRTTPQNE